MSTELRQFADVTIGIPVYNEEKRIRIAVRSAAAQCGRLIIADNASNDRTEAICRDLMSEYSNVEYFRHERNLGALENWIYLLSLVESEFFMTLGGHDQIGQGFVANLVQILRDDSEIVLAAGQLFYDYENPGSLKQLVDHNFNAWSGGMRPGIAERINSLLFADASLPWLTYGLFRTSVYRECFDRGLPAIGVDQVFLARIACKGKIMISPAAKYYAWVHRENNERDSYVKRILGKDLSSSLKKQSRNAMRLALFKILRDVERPATFIGDILLRMKIMIRYGPFKETRYDLLWLLLYVPSKIAGEMRRALRRYLKYIKRA